MPATRTSRLGAPASSSTGAITQAVSAGAASATRHGTARRGSASSTGATPTNRVSQHRTGGEAGLQNGRRANYGRLATTRRTSLMGPTIGIGGRLTAPPLPHHRAYGSVPRRFDRIKLGQGHGAEEDRGTRSNGCVGRVGPPGVLTCARIPSVNRRQPQPGTLLRHGDAVPYSGCARSPIAAKDTCVIFGESTLPSS